MLSYICRSLFQPQIQGACEACNFTGTQNILQFARNGAHVISKTSNVKQPLLFKKRTVQLIRAPVAAVCCPSGICVYPKLKMISGFVLPLGSCTRPVFSICSSSVAVSHRTSVIALQRAKTGTKWLPPVCSGADTASTAMQKKIPATDAVQSNVSFVSYDGSTFVLEYSASVLKKPARLIIDPWLDDDVSIFLTVSFFCE